MSAFTASELAPGRVAEALPLLHTIWPEIELGRWQNFAAFYSGGAERSRMSQLIGLFDAAGGLAGLFAHRVEQDLHEGRLLLLPLFIVADVGNSMKPIEVLLGAANDCARHCGCIGLRLQLSNRQRALSSRLRQLGLSPAAAGHVMKIALRPPAEHAANRR